MGRIIQNKVSVVGRSCFSGRYGLALARLGWSYRSLELELSDRFTRRWVSGSFTEENFLQARAVRRF